MKKTFLLITLCLSGILFNANAINIPLEKKNPSEPPIRPRSPMLIPVTVDLTLTDIYLNFINSIGEVNVTVKDSNETIVYQETIDTNTINEIYIDIDGWETDDYTIDISYGSISLRGLFTIE